jgi:hypothetical protein
MTGDTGRTLRGCGRTDLSSQGPQYGPGHSDGHTLPGHMLTATETVRATLTTLIGTTGEQGMCGTMVPQEQ